MKGKKENKEERQIKKKLNVKKSARAHQQIKNQTQCDSKIVINTWERERGFHNLINPKRLTKVQL